jgi:CheY-like chemotaxis protein
MSGDLRENAVILTIDDEPEVLASLTKALTSAGYTVHCAMTPQAALQTANEIRPDLVISDINLNGQSGLGLCERLKRETNLAQTPVIFLSGAQIPDIIRRAHAAGGSYYLRKPFDPQVLLELVDKALWMPHLVENRLTTV